MTIVLHEKPPPLRSVCCEAVTSGHFVQRLEAERLRLSRHPSCLPTQLRFQQSLYVDGLARERVPMRTGSGIYDEYRYVFLRIKR